MPRKNKRKPPKYHVQAPSIYDGGFKAKCHGCAFAGQGFVCLTSDGKCLKGGADANTNIIATVTAKTTSAIGGYATKGVDHAPVVG